MKVKIVREMGAKLPAYAHNGDAGMDLYSNVEDFVLKPMERKMISTGLKMEIPRGFAGLIWDKSGLAMKSGLKVMGGVIDSNYRGDVCVVLINLGSEDIKIERNTKIAQVLIQRIGSADVIETTVLSNTARNEDGFGSTGLE